MANHQPRATPARFPKVSDWKSYLADYCGEIDILDKHPCSYGWGLHLGWNLDELGVQTSNSSQSPMVLQHSHEVSPSWIVLKEAWKRLLKHYAGIEANCHHHQKNRPWAVDDTRWKFWWFVNARIIYTVHITVLKIKSNMFIFVMHSKVRLPKQFESRTLWKSVLPMELHTDLEEVPAFTAVLELHFRPKCVSQPSSMLPRSIAAKAVLGNKLEQSKRIWLFFLCWTINEYGTVVEACNFKKKAKSNISRWCLVSPFQHQTISS